MIIVIVMLFLLLISFFIPKHKFHYYMYISIGIITFFPFFIWPDNRFDLYRHILIMDEYHNLDLFQFVNADKVLSQDTISGLAAASNVHSYPIYSFAMYLISKIKIYQLLPVIISFIIYVLAIKRIIYIDKNESTRYMASIICFFIVLLSYNYLFIISNLRHPLVGAIFAYTAYEELVTQKNKRLCWLVYVLMPLIHSIGFLLLCIRILLLFYNRWTKYLILLCLFFSNVIFLPIAKILTRFSSGIIWIAADKYLRYITDRKNVGGMHVSTKLTILYIAILVIVLFFLHSRIKEKYKTYCELIIICIVLTFSMTGQSELFNRMEFVLIPVVIPVIQELVSEFSGFGFLSAKARLKGARCYQLGMAFFVAILVLNFGIACKKNYSVLSPYLSINNFMNNGDMEDPWNHEE